MKRIKLYMFATMILSMFFGQAIGAPVITNISGEIIDNAKIQIKGINFGIKDPVKPIIWADFENGSINPTDLGRYTSWNDISRLEITGLNQYAGSKYSAVGEWNSVIGNRAFSFRIDKSYWTKIYHYQKRYFSFDATGNQKFWRLWPESKTNNFLAIFKTTSAMCYNEIEGYVGGNVGGYQGKPYEKNKWNIEEFVWQYEGGSGLDMDGVNRSRGTGIWDYTRNGIKIQHRENVVNGEKSHKELRTDNFTDTNYLPPDGSKVYMDDIYIDDTYSRVMIGNDPSMDKSTHREIQIPVEWSNDSITIITNQGLFIEGDTVYLFVVDADGNVNAEGYQIKIAGETAGGPSAPANLRIE